MDEHQLKLMPPLKSKKTLVFVIPAKAVIRFFKQLQIFWTPAFAGVTTFYEIVKINTERSLMFRRGP
jgi:hypothetical protein